MDYSEKTNNDSLVYAQWEAIHNPALIGKMFQSDEDGASNDPEMLPEDIITILDSIRNSNIDMEEIISLTEFSLSEGVTYDLDQGILNFEFIKMQLGGLMKTKGVDGNNEPYEELYISPSDFTFESADDSWQNWEQGIEGHVTKFAFLKYDKNEDGSFTKSDDEAINFLVYGRQTQTVKAFIEGDDIPNIEFPCEICGRELKMDLERLKLIFGTTNTNATSSAVDAFNTAFMNEDIQFNTCIKQAHFFSQCYVESSEFTDFDEDYQYRLTSIYSTFGNQSAPNQSYLTLYNQDFWDKNEHLDYIGSNKCTHRYMQEDTTGTDKSIRHKGVGELSRTRSGMTIKFPETFELDEERNYFHANILSSEDQLEKGKNLFNLVYSDVEGNGDFNSGEGWKYRGRGIIQVTRKDNYNAVSKIMNEKFNLTIDIEKESDLNKFSEDIKYAIYSSVAWFYNRFKPLSILDDMSSEEVTEMVNSRSLEETKRKDKYDDLIENLNLYMCIWE
jgi:predicted chitinase